MSLTSVQFMFLLFLAIKNNRLKMFPSYQLPLKVNTLMSILQEPCSESRYHRDIVTI